MFIHSYSFLVCVWTWHVMNQATDWSLDSCLIHAHQVFSSSRIFTHSRGRADVTISPSKGHVYKDIHLTGFTRFANTLQVCITSYMYPCPCYRCELVFTCQAHVVEHLNNPQYQCGKFMQDLDHRQVDNDKWDSEWEEEEEWELTAGKLASTLSINAVLLLILLS